MPASPPCRAPAPPSCPSSPSSLRAPGSSSRSCTWNPAASTKCSAPSPPEASRQHAQRGHHHAPRAGELLRNAARVRFHRHLPVACQLVRLLPRLVLRARPGGSRLVLRLSPLVVPVPDSGPVDEAVGGGAQL